MVKTENLVLIKGYYYPKEKSKIYNCYSYVSIEIKDYKK